MSNKKYKKLNEIAILSMMTGLSIILSYIETLIPINIGSYGIRVGLTNIVTILLLKHYGFFKTILVNIIRLIVIGILFSSLIRFILSISGFILSFMILYVLMMKIEINVVISSAFAGLSHNIGQVLALSILTNNRKVLLLIFPYIIIGIIAGGFVGTVVVAIEKRLKFI